MTTYYVDATGGADGNDGITTGTAWQTIGKVNGESFNPGDGIMFLRGEEWRERLTPTWSGSVGNEITFGAYGNGDDPIIKASTLVVTWGDEGSNVWSAALTSTPAQVFFDGTKGIKEAAQVNLDAENEWFWESNVLYVYSTGDPDDDYTSPGIEAGITNACILVDTYNYLIFENLHTLHAKANNIDLRDSDYCDIVNCESEYAFTNGLSLDNCDYFNVTNGHYHYNGDGSIGGGVLIWNGSKENIVDGVESNNNVEDGIALAGGVGERVGADNIVQNCDLHDNSEDGIDIKNADQSILDNTITDNAHYGLFIHNTAGTIVSEGNTFTDNAWCNTVIHDGAGPVESYGNYYGYTGSPSTQNASVHIGTAANNCKFYYDIFVGGDLRQLQIESGTGHLVYNCDFYNPSDGTNGLLRFTAGSDNNTVKNCAFYGNGYHCLKFEAGSVVTASDYNSFYRSDSANDWIYVNDTSYSKAEIDDGTIYAEKGTEESSITGDPLWTDPGSDDFTLQPGSGCRNAGTDVGLTEDYVGVSVPQETNPAIGAYEYTPRDIYWGHVTGVVEEARTFVNNWTGSATIVGSGDGEQVCISAGEDEFSEIVFTGLYTVELVQNIYDGTGDDVTLAYRHSGTMAAVENASWVTYSAPFTSLGYVQVRTTPS